MWLKAAEHDELGRVWAVRIDPGISASRPIEQPRKIPLSLSAKKKRPPRGGSAARKAELAQLKAEMAGSAAEAKAKLQKRVSEVKAKLDELSSQAQTKLQKLEKDTNAKISALNDQIAKATAENKARIKERLVELRADHDRRAARLKQAGALIREALAA